MAIRYVQGASVRGAQGNFVGIVGVVGVAILLTVVSNSMDGTKRKPEPVAVEQEVRAAEKPAEEVVVGPGVAESPDVAPAEPEAVVSSVSFQEFDAFFGLRSSATDLQKDEAMASKYKGLWVEWSGEVVDVGLMRFLGRRSTTLLLRHKPDSIGSDVAVGIDAQDEASVRELTKGQMVRYRAQIEGYGELMGHHLRHGRVVRVIGG
jgi:hypothetical protein